MYDEDWLLMKASCEILWLCFCDCVIILELFFSSSLKMKGFFLWSFNLQSLTFLLNLQFIFGTFCLFLCFKPSNKIMIGCFWCLWCQKMLFLFSIGWILWKYLHSKIPSVNGDECMNQWMNSEWCLSSIYYQTSQWCTKYASHFYSTLYCTCIYCVCTSKQWWWKGI
jgi:hypothetical protein